MVEGGGGGEALGKDVKEVDESAGESEEFVVGQVAF